MVLFPIFAGTGICHGSRYCRDIQKYREQIGEKIGFYAIRGAAVVMIAGTYLLTQAGK